MEVVVVVVVVMAGIVDAGGGEIFSLVVSGIQVNRKGCTE